MTIYDSTIDGEYLAWNTKNIKLINCTIESDQGLNYIDQLEIKNSDLIHTDLAFEYVSNLDVEVNSAIDSVKNPISGKISAPDTKGLIKMTATNYDFVNAPDRCHTNSIKWDVKNVELPMWIADMDFKTTPEIIEVMQKSMVFVLKMSG